MIGQTFTLEELMRRFRVESYAALSWRLGQLRVGLENPLELELNTKHYQDFRKDFPLYERDLERLELSVSLAAFKRLVAELDNASPGKEKVQAITYFQVVLADELRSRVFLQLESHRVPLAFEPHRFGEEVDLVFHSAAWDIQEAARCLVFERSTACVFHLMRVMEVGLRVLGVTLHLPTTSNRSWEAVLKKCDTEIAKPFAEKSPEWQAEEVFFANAAARLRAVKDAWRNPTMHVEAKYTQEEAQEIWEHVGSFMRHLATKLKEPNSDS